MSRIIYMHLSYSLPKKLKNKVGQNQKRGTQVLTKEADGEGRDEDNLEKYETYQDKRFQQKNRTLKF